MVIHAGDDLQLGVVVQEHAAHHVHLPQLHRAIALPAAELVTALASPPQLDQTVALQAPVDRRARRDRLDAETPELVLDPARSPPRVFAAQLADPRLDLGDGLVGAAGRSVRSVSERGEPTGFVASDPGVDALS